MFISTYVLYNSRDKNKMIACKRCKGTAIRKAGKIILSNRVTQRYQCKECGLVFHI
jgi:transposase-like protein